MPQSEISYDLIMNADMSFAEGTYRLQGGPWQVFSFTRKDVKHSQWIASTWGSGVMGIVVHFPRSAILNEAVVESTLSSALGVTNWSRVRGPDSMQLR